MIAVDRRLILWDPKRACVASGRPYNQRRLAQVPLLRNRFFFLAEEKTGFVGKVCNSHHFRCSRNEPSTKKDSHVPCPLLARLDRSVLPLPGVFHLPKPVRSRLSCLWR